MTTLRQNLQTLLAALIALTLVGFTAQGANLSDKDKQFLGGYDKLRAALAADDLGKAKTAAKELGDDGTDFMKAISLADARVAFEKLSAKAKGLITGQSGFYVVHCPMLKKDWVQTSDKIENPYGGKNMLTCGEVKK